ncbi:MAG: helix-turn-helix domain-containing protein, partial [Alcanivoracaceae bacterium]|nr:helix-turn-helix domain-containing protein [Alcanivoracaceae bacterium]
MSHQELDRLEVLKLIASKRINQIQGAKQLDLSTRQLRRIQLNYRKDGAKGIISKNRGKASNNKFNDEFKLEIVTLIKENYHDFGPTFAHEKLVENHNKNFQSKALG